MIIETHNDVVLLSGSLCTNQWPAIKATADLVYTHHPMGILIDCSGLSYVTRVGAKTFEDALQHIERERYAVVFTHVPVDVKQMLSTIGPGNFDADMETQNETRRISQAIWSTRWWEQLWGADTVQTSQRSWHNRRWRRHRLV
jgi:anti-anti-sigma regulatory factor